MTVDISVSFPLDRDGFLRRECPHCERQFKWHNGPANAEAEFQPAPAAYHCPHCGRPAAGDSWWTQDQLTYMNGMVGSQGMRAVQDELAGMFRGGGMKFTPGDVGKEPDPLFEPDDMVLIASPCHGYEPVKVPDGALSPFYCLVCGAPFVV